VWYIVAASDIGVGIKSCTCRGLKLLRFKYCAKAIISPKVEPGCPEM
jgi:hypothetical protein